jgi:peptidoglycan hydrolase-like protein with peptidoglycan-binding domain
MVWRGGFTGRGYTREEFRAFLRTQNRPTWVQFFVAHNTAAPYIKPPVTPAQRVINLAHYYKTKGWPTGPNLIAIYDRVYVGTPLAYAGTNSPGFNGKGLGVEVEGDYDGTHNPLLGDGLVAWKTAAWVFAELSEWLNIPIDNVGLKLHKEDPRTTHDCPGKLVKKPWLLDLVREAQGRKGEDLKPPAGPEVKVTAPVKIPKQMFPVKEIQERLLVHGYKLPKWGADGIMGAETYAAIVALQVDLRVSPSGLVGPWVMEQLRKTTKPEPVPVQPDPLPIPAIPNVALSQSPPVIPIVAPGQPEPNPAKAMRLLQTVALWPKHWAAGAVAQAQRESYPDLRPWAQGDWFLHGKPSKKGVEGAKPTAFGIWQLRNDRYDNFLSFAAERGTSWDDFETQVLWCPLELKTSEKLAWKWLQRAQTVEQANAAMVWYERPAGYISSRAKAATTWDEVFNVSEKCDGYDVRLKFAKALM